MSRGIEIRPTPIIKRYIDWKQALACKTATKVMALLADLFAFQFQDHQYGNIIAVKQAAQRGIVSWEPMGTRFEHPWVN